MARAEPDGPCQPLGPAGAGHDADADLRLTELRVVTRDDEVARHGQLAAATEREAADRGDKGDTDRAEPVPRVEVALGSQTLRGLVGQLDDVGARREGPVARAR